MTRYGYAAMNVTLREEDDVRTNRGMRKASFEERGLEYAGELAEQNCRGLKRVVEWNLDHDIHYYRIASDLLPWFSRYDLDDLPNAEAVRGLLETVGNLARKHDMRLTFHPDHFVKLASNKEAVVERSLTDLENHGTMLDAMGLPRTPYNAINASVALANQTTTGSARNRHGNSLLSLPAIARGREVKGETEGGSTLELL